MSGFTDSAGSILVQEHASSGFDVQCFSRRVDAAMRLIRTELCRCDRPEDVITEIRSELELMIIQYELDMQE